VFKFMKHIFAEWLDWNDPETKKEPKTSQKNERIDLRRDLIKFPYQVPGG